MNALFIDLEKNMVKCMFIKIQTDNQRFPNAADEANHWIQ